jgi:hypothetical protein
LDYEAGSWFLGLAADDLDRPGPLRLRLAWGSPGEVRVTVLDVDADCGRRAPAASLLAWEREPWPNPFNPRVSARFALADPAVVRVGVYDLAGRLVADLSAGRREAGSHTVTWDGTGPGGPAGAGIYFLRIDSPRQVLSRKVMLLK